jgi:arylsulfatase A-like enzyme
MKIHTTNTSLALAVTLSAITPAVAQSQQAENPNVLLIMTDQQSWDAVGYAGNKIIKTPHLDRLASEGVNFSQAVTGCPVSAPARTSILTGRLIETTTIRGNNDLTANDCFYPTFDEILAKKGYAVEYYGKFHSPYHMANVYTNPTVDGKSSFEQIVKWEPNYVDFLRKKIQKRPLKKDELYETSFYGGTIPYRPDPPDTMYEMIHAGNKANIDVSEKRSQADVHGVLDLAAEYTITAIQGQQTIEALERLKDKPFVLTASFHCPHVPITPSEPYASMYKPEDMVPYTSITDKRSNSPYHPNVENAPYNAKEKVQYMIANYYAFVTEIDDWVGKILDKLDELNLTQNTLVIFVSDHGEMLGAHGMRGKFCFYEESVRVPFLMRYPGKIPEGKTITTPVSIMNIFPTILDYAGLKNIPSDGYSMRGIMEGTNLPKYDFAISEWMWKQESVPSLMIRTEQWKLMTTHRAGGKNVEVLYDLVNDPHEMNNLLGSNPERFKYKEITEALRSKLVGYLKDVNSPLTEGVEKRVLIRGSN